MAIPAHGGALINRIVHGDVRDKLLEECKSIVRIELDEWSVSDLDLIGCGAFSPLHGFMNEADYRSVLSDMRLSDGTIWPIPITLAVPEGDLVNVKLGDTVALHGQADGIAYGVLQVESIYRIDQREEAQCIYGTADPDHPGVAKLYSRSSTYVGGSVQLLNRPRQQFADYNFDPAETRETFRKKGWKTVCGFQTRNPIHRAHEYIQKCAMEVVDGLFLHPLVGETKPGDLPAEVRMKSYRVMLSTYYPKQRVHLGVFPAAMRYAGPREAVFHALVRKNYGCTHFIVGRDHAGVGDYYGTYDAQRLIESFRESDLGIVPLCFEHAFYCKRCENMATSKTCPHPPEYRLHLSGTKVRAMLSVGMSPPAEFTRPEVAALLLENS